MKVKRILAIIIITDCLGLGFLFFLFATPVPYEAYTGDGFSCMVPADAPVVIFDEYNWHKHSFSKKGELYISHYQFEGTFEKEMQSLGKYLKGAAFQKEIKVFDNGWFFLYARGRGWRKYIYLFSYEQEIFWVENLTRNSTLLTFKEVADNVVTTLKINGTGTDSSLPASIEDINKQIIRYTQDPYLFLGILGTILLATTLFFPAVLFYFGGAVPSQEMHSLIRKEQWVYMTIRAKLKYKGTFGGIALTAQGLTLYYFKRPLLSVARGEGDRVSLEKEKGKACLVIQEGTHLFRIYVADPHLWMNDIQSQLTA